MGNNEVKTTEKNVPDMEVVKAAKETMLSLYKTSTAKSDRDGMIKAILAEKNSNKDLAYSLILGICESGLCPGSDLVHYIASVPPGETSTKVPVLIDAFIKVEPGDEDALAVMDSIKANHPGLLADIVASKKSWKSSDIRRQLLKHVFTRELWIKLGSMAESLQTKVEEEEK